jgi:hypothetical protein
MWLQFAIPIASGIIMTGVFAIPFAYFWPPMSKVQAWLALLLGLAYLIYCIWAQRRQLRRDGLIPPFG